MALFDSFIAKAKSLTGQGRLLEATKAIQEGLGIATSAPERQETAPAATPQSVARRAASGFAFDPASAGPAEDIAYRETPLPSRAPVADETERGISTPSSFERGEFEHGGRRYAYRLFVPSRRDDAPLPLVVMLHGCKQDSEDFAKGTGMNAVAEREKFIVLYPEQLRQGNSMGCWNWFEPSHQARGQGEPAMINALASHVIATRGADASKVYVAGLSAGGAMAAIMGSLYPEMFAAVGVHSGLAPGAARDVASAFSAMSKGPKPQAKLRAIGVPTIIFQGSGDSTVAATNADAIVKTEIAAWAVKGTLLRKTVVPDNAGGAERPTTKTAWRDESGEAALELWSVAAGPHAWSGGDPAGTFVDPKGPSASKAIFEFFKSHSKQVG